MENSHDVVKILKEIGGPEILERLDKSIVLLEMTGNTGDKNLAIVKEFSEVGEPQIQEKLDTSKILMETTGKTVDKSHAMVKEFKEVGEVEIIRRLTNLKNLLLITLASSILAIIVGLVALFG